MCDMAEAMCKAQARWDEIAVPLCPHELKVRRGTAMTAVKPKRVQNALFRNQSLCRRCSMFA